MVGVALGDGNLSNPNGRAVRLRVTCDSKYPILLSKIARYIQIVCPDNKVSLVDRKNCVDVSRFSNKWEAILGWKVGSKFSQNVGVPHWIFEKENLAAACLCGLIETDGSIYVDRGYRMVFFTNIIKRLAEDVSNMMRLLDFAPRFYTVRPPMGVRRSDREIYHVRLAKDVQRFLDLVHPLKC